jgi:NitT/TauT family transport system ATP-binding protein
MTVKIEARGVGKRYSVGRAGTPFAALQGVDLDVQEGEFLCIVGPSGCGKSTFLQMVAGLEPVSEGTLRINGRAVQGPGADRGMVFQSYALFPWRTVMGNIEFGLEVKGYNARERHEIALRCAHNVGLRGFEQAYPSQLSGGMKQRVGIARALANDPEVLLMDEPFASVDAQTREMLQEEVLSIWRKANRTVLFVTHSVQEAVYLGSRIAVMTARPGRVKTIIDVDLPYPRDITSAEFGNLMKPVYAVLKDEVLKTTKAAAVELAETGA